MMKWWGYGFWIYLTIQYNKNLFLFTISHFLLKLGSILFNIFYYIPKFTFSYFFWVSSIQNMFFHIVINETSENKQNN